MSDTKTVTRAGARPLSPHLQVYRMPLNAVLSILHRITGAAMSVSAALVVWWFLAAATSEGYFALVNGLLTSWPGDIVLSLSVLGLWFHFCNGIRHLVWDTGSHFGRKRVRQTGILAVLVTLVLTAITLFVI